MTSGQRGGIALAFVAVIGVVLARPVLTAGSDPTPAPVATATEEPSETPTEEPSPTPTEEPSPTPTETEEPEGPPAELAAAFPPGCLTPQPLETEPGSVAAISRRGIFISSPTGEVTSRIRGADGPVGFSPSGDYLLTGAGVLFRTDGSELGPLFGDAVLGWAWSPQSDCALAADADGQLLVAAPGEEPTVLLEGPVQNFAVSAARLAVSTDPGLVSIYNLRSGRMLGEPALLEGGPIARLVGWRGDSLVYASGSETALDLLAIEARPGRTRTRDLGAQVGPALAVPCGDRLVGVSPDGELIDVDEGPLAAAGGSEYGRPACSPSGTFIAVPRRPEGGSDDDFRMVILEPDGTYIQDAGPGGSGAEGSPEWSTSGSQLIFVKASGNVGELWYAQSGGGGASGIRVALAPGSLDWNITPPSGLPAQ